VSLIDHPLNQLRKRGHAATDDEEGRSRVVPSQDVEDGWGSRRLRSVVEREVYGRRRNAETRRTFEPAQLQATGVVAKTRSRGFNREDQVVTRLRYQDSFPTVLLIINPAQPVEACCACLQSQNGECSRADEQRFAEHKLNRNPIQAAVILGRVKELH